MFLAEFCQVHTYMPSSPSGVYKPLVTSKPKSALTVVSDDHVHIIVQLVSL